MKTNFIYTFLLLMICGILHAQPTPAAQKTSARLLGKTKPLKDLIKSHRQGSRAKKIERRNEGEEVVNFINIQPPPSNAKAPLPLGNDPLWQLDRPEENAITAPPLFITEGTDISQVGVLPPDVNGACGRNHYMHAVNATFILVTDKLGNKIDSFTTDMFWQVFGLSAAGDPVILYDETADRWLITEFADIFDNTLLVAVSETSDPFGAYFTYEFVAPNFPDYPKYGIWPNAYYISTNEGQDANIPVYFLDREAMLRGDNVADIQRLGIPKFPRFQVDAFQIATPADWAGTRPPEDSSRMFIMRLYDDDWGGGLGEDRIEIWEAFIDWEDETNSTMTGPTEIFTAPFDAALCGRSFTPCVPQPNGQVLFPIDNVLMFPITYRNFGTHEAMIFSFTVQLDDIGRSGIRWVELRRTDRDWELYQEGTYATEDNTFAFMSSININAKGDIALGYSTSSSFENPAMRYTGRRSIDPLGTMTVREEIIAQSLAPQNAQRWGDYSSVDVDPIDSTTFWFTHMYVKQSVGGWGTRITSFRITRDSFDITAERFEEIDLNASAFTSTENPTVRVKNAGLKEAFDFTVALYLDDTLLVERLFTDTIQPDSSLVVDLGQTLDFSAFGFYELVAITSLTGDSICVNDTLRATLNNLAERDITLDLLDNSALSVSCGGDLPIVAMNRGTDTVTSFSLSAELNGTMQTVDWTGVLLPAQSVVVDIPNNIGFVAPGELEVDIRVLTVNGDVDQIDQMEDRIETTFMYDNNTEKLSLNLTLDRFPGETTWQLLTIGLAEIYSGGPYAASQGLDTVVEELCVEDDLCYVFRLFDSAGDGFEDPGGYTITNENDVVLASLQNNGIFQVDVNNFCPGNCTNYSVQATSSPTSSPVAIDGTIMVEVVNASNFVRYTITGDNLGAPRTNTSGVFNDLPSGNYEVTARDNVFNCEAVDNVFVDFVSSTHLVGNDLTFSVSPNPTDDIVNIRITGLVDQPNAHLQLIDASGRVVLPVRLGNYNGEYTGMFKMDGLPSGVYFLRFEDARIKKMAKIVKK